jgi:hypothetical protein
MKNLITITLSLLAINLSIAQTTVPNGDFENWTDQYHIQYWDGLNYDGGFINFHTFLRTDDAHSGNYAAQVQTINNSIIGILPGIAFTGNIDFNPSTFEYTFKVGVPVQGRPSGLNGFFKYSPSGGDSLALVVGMFKWNQEENDLDSIGGGFFFTSGTVNSYTGFTIPIQYFFPDLEADTMYVMMFSSLDANHAGSTLKVDDLTLSIGTIGIGEQQDSPSILVFPNPSSGYLQVKYTGQYQQSRLVISDLMGRIMLDRTFNTELHIDLPCEMADGIYFARIIQAGITMKTEKLVVRR